MGLGCRESCRQGRGMLGSVASLANPLPMSWEEFLRHRMTGLASLGCILASGTRLGDLTYSQRQFAKELDIGDKQPRHGQCEGDGLELFPRLGIIRADTCAILAILKTKRIGPGKRRN